MAGTEQRRLVSDLARVPGAVVLAALGCGALAWLGLTLPAQGDGRPWPQVLVSRAGYLLSTGSVALGLLVTAWRLAQDPLAPRTPAALDRVCPGCGRLAAPRAPRDQACPRCDLPGTAPGWTESAPHTTPLRLLSGGLLLGGGSCFAVLRMIAVLSAPPRSSPGPGLWLFVSLLLALGSALCLGEVARRMLAQRRARRRSNALRFVANLRAGSVLQLLSEAWFDQGQRLQRASGVSSCELSSSAAHMPVALLSPDRVRVLRLLARLEWRQRLGLQRVRTLTWTRRWGAPPAVAPTGYRDASSVKPWTCEEVLTTPVSIKAAHDPGHRLRKRLGWASTECHELAHLVQRLEGDRALFDAVARLGRRTSGLPEPDPVALTRRIEQLAALAAG